MKNYSSRVIAIRLNTWAKKYKKQLWHLGCLIYLLTDIYGHTWSIHRFNVLCARWVRCGGLDIFDLGFTLDTGRRWAFTLALSGRLLLRQSLLFPELGPSVLEPHLQTCCNKYGRSGSPFGGMANSAKQFLESTGRRNIDSCNTALSITVGTDYSRDILNEFWIDHIHNGIRAY